MAKTRRARADEMLAEDRRQLPILVGVALHKLGAQVQFATSEQAAIPFATAVVYQYDGIHTDVRYHGVPISFWLDTWLGQIKGSVEDTHIFAKWADPKLVELAHGPELFSRLNPHSGKWNFTFGRITAEDATITFAQALVDLLDPFLIMRRCQCPFNRAEDLSIAADWLEEYDAEYSPLAAAMRAKSTEDLHARYYSEEISKKLAAEATTGQRARWPVLRAGADSTPKNQGGTS